MSASNVRQLPSGRNAQTIALERKAIGGLLDLPDKQALLEAAGLSPSDFVHQRYGDTLGVIRSLVDRRIEVTAATVAAVGKTAGKLDETDLEWLADCRATNEETKESLLALCNELRVHARARTTREALVREVQAIDSGRFSPSRAAGVLDGIAMTLSRDFVPDETAEADLMEVNATWDRNVEAGTTEWDPTGVRILDQALGGGWAPRLGFIAGAPGTGKTGLLASIIKAQLELEPSTPVLDPETGLDTRTTTALFGLEDGTDWLVRRWLAEAIGIKLGDVGSLRLDDEKKALRDAANDRFHPLVTRIRTYKRDSITPRNLVRMLNDWAYRPLPGFAKGIRRAYVDHLGELDLNDEQAIKEYWRQVGEGVRLTRNFSYRTGIPVIFLVHDTDEEANKPGAKEGPPNPSKLAGGRAIDRKARQILGVWNYGGPWGEWRGTVLKNTTGGPRGVTVGFERVYDAAMVKANEGRIIDLKKEAADAAAEREKKAEDKAAEKKKKQDEERREKKRKEREEREQLEREAAEKKAAELAKKSATPAQISFIAEAPTP